MYWHLNLRVPGNKSELSNLHHFNTHLHFINLSVTFDLFRIVGLSWVS